MHHVLTSALNRQRRRKRAQAGFLALTVEKIGADAGVLLIVGVVKFVVHFVQTASPLLLLLLNFVRKLLEILLVFFFMLLLFFERVVLLVAEGALVHCGHIHRWLRHQGQLKSLLVDDGLSDCLLDFLLALVLGLLKSLFECLFFEDPVIHKVKVETFTHESFSKH